MASFISQEKNLQSSHLIFLFCCSLILNIFINFPLLRLLVLFTPSHFSFSPFVIPAEFGDLFYYSSLVHLLSTCLSIMEMDGKLFFMLENFLHARRDLTHRMSEKMQLGWNSLLLRFKESISISILIYFHKSSSRRSTCAVVNSLNCIFLKIFSVIKIFIFANLSFKILKYFSVSRLFLKFSLSRVLAKRITLKLFRKV